MQINTSAIQYLPVESRKKLIDYVEGMPSSLNKYLKMILSEDYMDPSFFNTKRRELSQDATIGKYLGKKVTIVPAKSPDTLTSAQTYQREYCFCIRTINSIENDFSAKVRYKLESILNAECYDIETLIKVEVYIGEFLKELSQDREMINNPDKLKSVAEIITNFIMPYKYTGYDLYTYLVMNTDMQLREVDYNYMTAINGMIHRLMLVKSSLTAFSDIGVLIYIYFKYLGMEDHIFKYNLFERFKLTMNYLGIGDDYITETQERLIECVNSKLNTTMASSVIVNSTKLNTVDNKERVEIPIMTGSPNIDESNGFIFSFKNIKDLDPNLLDELGIWLRSLTKDEILQYTDIKPENLTFDLNDNDIGHIRNENKINIGTVYNSSSKEIRYIIEKDNAFFLLFKDRMNSRVVHGISIKRYPSTADCDKPRTAITIKESTNFCYKYISEI